MLNTLMNNEFDHEFNLNGFPEDFIVFLEILYEIDIKTIKDTKI